MTVSPALVGVLTIGGVCAGALLFILLLLKFDGLRKALNQAFHLLAASDAPKDLWARPLLWLSGAVLGGATAWSWVFVRDFAADPLWAKTLALAVIGYFLWIAGHSLIRLFRPPQTPIAETGTPA